MQPVTPRGFRDVLFDEAREREAVTNAISRVLVAWGYNPVETPVVEEYATLEAGVGRLAEKYAFRLFDLDGSLLALRPEMTVPVARLAASRLRETAGPHRMRYVTDVFREHTSLRGQARQFTQAGIELVGAHGPAADAEVVCVMVDALTAAGLEPFTVAIGTAEVLRGLLERAGGSAEWRDAVIGAAHERNLVEIDRLAARDDLAPEVAEALRTVPRLRGGAEALDSCMDVTRAAGCVGVVDELGETWRMLSSLGLGDRVTLDFGIMRSFGYYTGVQFEAYAPGLGLPLGGGGRYDRLLGSFGTPMPAAGFALGLERLMIALAEQGRIPRLEPLDAVVGGVDPVAVFAAGARLRAADWRVRLAPGSIGVPLVREADRWQAAEALMAEGAGIVRVDRAGEPAGEVGDPVPAPPRRTWAASAGEHQ